MKYQIEKLPDEPIIIGHVQESASTAEENNLAIGQLMELLDQQTQPVILIFEMLTANMSLDDLIQGAAIAARQRAMYKHPMLRENVIVTQSRLIDLASRGMSSATFGHLKIRTYKTLDEALAYARGVTSAAGTR